MRAPNSAAEIARVETASGDDGLVGAKTVAAEPADGAAGTAGLTMAGTGIARVESAITTAGLAGTEAVRTGAHEAMAKVAQQTAVAVSRVRTGRVLLSSRTPMPNDG